MGGRIFFSRSHASRCDFLNDCWVLIEEFVHHTKPPVYVKRRQAREQAKDSQKQQNHTLTLNPKTVIRHGSIPRADGYFRAEEMGKGICPSREGGYPPRERVQCSEGRESSR